MNGFRVKSTIEGAHPQHPKYPLLPGDLMVQQSDGLWMKEAPGLAVGGFYLSDEQVMDDLELVEFSRHGLAYVVGSGA